MRQIALGQVTGRVYLFFFGFRALAEAPITQASPAPSFTMCDLAAEAEQWNDQVQQFAAFTGVIDHEPNDRFFLVMGMTGSGKSTFISRGLGQAVTVGHGLYSCETFSSASFACNPLALFDGLSDIDLSRY